MFYYLINHCGLHLYEFVLYIYTYLAIPWIYDHLRVLSKRGKNVFSILRKLSQSLMWNENHIWGDLSSIIYAWQVCITYDCGKVTTLKGKQVKYVALNIRALTTLEPHRTIRDFPLLQYTYIVLWRATDAARLALYALPLVRPHSLHHVVSELQTCGVTCVGTARRGEKSEGRKEGVMERIVAEKFTKQSQWCFLM